MKRLPKRLIRYFFELIGTIVIVAVLGFGALMVRLDKSPIVLTSSIAEIESMLNGLSPGLAFKIKTVQMETNTHYRAIRLRLNGVKVFNAKGEPVGKLQEALLSYNWRNLAGASAIPVAIRIANPAVAVTRFTNGSVGFNLQDKQTDQQSAASLNDVGKFLRNTSGTLRHIRITNAYLRYNDLQADYAIEGLNGLFDFNRTDGDQLNGTMTVDVKAKEFEQRLQGTIAFDPTKKVNHVIIGMKDFMLSKIRGLTSRIPVDLHVTTPVNLLLTADIDPQLQLTGVDFLITGENIAVNYAPYFPVDTAFKEVLLNAHYAPREKTITLNSLIAKFGPSQLLVKGSMAFDRQIKSIDDSTITVGMQASVENVPLDSLKEYWPATLGHNAREWVVSRLHDGKANRAKLDVQLVLPPEQAPQIKKLQGTIGFHDVSVNYLPPMPEIKNVDGSVVFNDQNFDITLNSGKVMGLTLPKGFVRINNLTGQHQGIEIAVQTKGPIHDAVQLISSKPFEYAQKMGMAPDQFTGNTTIDLNLAFPLLMALKLDQVQMKTTAVLENMTAKNIIKDLGITAKNLTMVVDEHHLTMDGNVVVEGSPAKVQWQEYFDKEAENGTVITAQGEITPAILKALKLPGDGYFSGSAPADLKLTRDNDKTVFVDIDANITPSTLRVPQIKLEKKSGAPGKLALKIANDKNGLVTLSDGSVSWPGFSIAQGMARFNANKDLESATLKNMRIDRSKADVIVTPKGKDTTQIVVRGDVIDASNAWAEMKSKSSKDPNPRRYEVSLRANKIFLDPDVPFLNMKADLALRGDDLETADITAQLDQKGALSMRQTVQKDNSRILAIRADNTGRVLQALDISDGVYGGQLSVDGKSTPQEPRVITGNTVLINFTMIKAPIMARLLNAFSLGGLLGLLNDKGLAFSKLQSDFSLPDAKTIRLKNGKMAGASLGLSFSGYIYRDSGELNVKGTIVPLEGINKFFGKIPLLGQILTGIKGNGIIGATYTIKGPGADPSVRVNPLSALTPGIFRSILFEGED